MAEMMIDLRAILVEREDCDAGTVTKVREALGQGGTQFRSLREATDLLRKKVEGSTGATAKKWHLKLGIALYFLGHVADASEHLRQAEGALANFYLGRTLSSRHEFDEALKAFERAEKSGYTASQVNLQRAGIYRQKGELTQARAMLHKMQDQASHSAEYHFQMASCLLADGERAQGVRHLERAVELDPGHTGALFQLGHANDLAGNDDDAMHYYERAIMHPPVHLGSLMNLGVLYEDNERFDRAAACYRHILNAEPLHEQARMFLKDSLASTTMYYSPDDERDQGRYSQVMEIPVTDFELSVRARNCLKKMNIKTLGDLTRVNEQQLLSSKNFGETSLDEIRDMLTSKGLRLGQSLDQGNQYERFRAPQPMNEQEAAILSKPVSDLNLSVRARKCMNRLAINSLSELVQRTADELLEAKNFGMTSLNEVREKLAQYGLTLRGD